ncbi:MAG: hypothetical protein ACREJ3_12265 [Polyangiaceae bacterium]
MIRIGRPVTAVLSALLAIGVCGSAAAQSADPPANESPSQKKETAQERFDREKVTLKDHAQATISSADANINALKRMSATAKAHEKKVNERIEKKLTALSESLKNDLGKIDKTTMNDWVRVRPMVEDHIVALQTEVERAATTTKVAPPSGAANKQPTK